MMNQPPKSSDEDNKRGFKPEKQSKHLPPLIFDKEEEQDAIENDEKQPPIDSTMKKVIQDLIGRGDLEGALKKLVEFLPPNARNEALILKGKWETLRKQKIIGVLDYREESIELNKITNSVLMLVDQPITDTSSENTYTQDNRGYSGNKTAKKKILFMSANPTNESRLQIDNEFRQIGTMLSQAGKRDSFELLIPQLSLQITDFIKALKNKPNIVHFSGHGQEDGLIISDKRNQAKELAIVPLQLQFRKHKDSVELIILNSCYSAIQAEILSQLGIYVVGMNAPIGDQAAINFTTGIYIGIGAGDSIESAYIDAITMVANENPEYAGLPEIWKDGKKLTIF